jgi:hypothetical protein
MFLTGCNTISYKTLEKLKAFYESGGTIISTTQLPHKSSEIGEDKKVIELVQDIFGINALEQDSAKIQNNSNEKGGAAIFIPKPDKINIKQALESISPDVQFVSNPELETDFGKFSYIHKIKDGNDIFYFANSSDEQINTEVLLKGKLDLENWNPHNGTVFQIKDIEIIEDNGQVFTKCKLNLKPVSSMFWLGKQ